LQDTLQRQFPGRFVAQRRCDLLARRQEAGGEAEQPSGEHDRQEPVPEQMQHPMIVPCQADAVTLTLGPRAMLPGDFAVMAIPDRTPGNTGCAIVC
jgi:hypothetical protein